jgi:hypothetical protein
VFSREKFFGYQVHIAPGYTQTRLGSESNQAADGLYLPSRLIKEDIFFLFLLEAQNSHFHSGHSSFVIRHPSGPFRALKKPLKGAEKQVQNDG